MSNYWLKCTHKEKPPIIKWEQSREIDPKNIFALSFGEFGTVSIMNPIGGPQYNWNGEEFEDRPLNFITRNPDGLRIIEMLDFIGDKKITVTAHLEDKRVTFENPTINFNDFDFVCFTIKYDKAIIDHKE